MLICRSTREIPESEKRKITIYNVEEKAVMSLMDVDSIYVSHWKSIAKN